MKEKTAKALYALLKELYQSRAAKEFVDTYEREEHDRRHRQQACKPEAVKPEVSDVYRDIFGNRYIVIGVHDEEPFKKSFVTLIYFNARAELRSSEVFSVPLEDFMNPTFKKE